MSNLTRDALRGQVEEPLIDRLTAGIGEVYRMVHYHRAQWSDVDDALERLVRLTAQRFSEPK